MTPLAGWKVKLIVRGVESAVTGLPLTSEAWTTIARIGWTKLVCGVIVGRTAGALMEIRAIGVDSAGMAKLTVAPLTVVATVVGVPGVRSSSGVGVGVGVVEGVALGEVGGDAPGVGASAAFATTSGRNTCGRKPSASGRAAAGERDVIRAAIASRPAAAAKARARNRRNRRSGGNDATTRLLSATRFPFPRRQAAAPPEMGGVASWPVTVAPFYSAWWKIARGARRLAPTNGQAPDRFLRDDCSTALL